MGLIYNVIEGLLPDKSFGVNIETQNILAWTVGLGVAIYYLGFLKKEYDLVFFQKKSIEIKTISIFSLFMLIIFFIIPYTVTQSLEFSRFYFLIFFTSFLFLALIGIGRQQYKKFKEHKRIWFKIRELIGFLGFVGLVSLPASILIFGDNQTIEQTCFSSGFLVLSTDFFLSYKRKEEVKQNIWLHTLSQRETEILKLLLDNPNLKNSEISQQLCISEKTVSTHLSNIYKKTGLTGKKEIKGLGKLFPNILDI